ncbi:MAG TPA: aldolase/citrate lyase family protein [Acidimicrobiales bacterium]|nr:aldolase/citrate lyase family protein [Acidimicrobiales bacterium]
MSAPRHLNGAIATLENGGTVFTSFCVADRTNALAVAPGPYDAVVFEMEHNPFDVMGLRDSLQYLLDRRLIAERDDLSPVVTPFARIPANGSEMTQWLAKQVLDVGVYGVVCPHVSTAAEARNAVGACRYRKPESAERYDPPGMRGDQPQSAARYWGVDIAEYYRRADVWPLVPEGEILVVIQCETKMAIRNLPDILANVPGIGVVLIGEGDLSQDLGRPREYEHPEVESAVADILSICQDFGIPCGIPHVTADNVERRIGQGFRWLMSTPERTNQAVDLGRKHLLARGGERS